MSRPMKRADEAVLMTPGLSAGVRKFRGETAMSRRRAMTIVGAMAGLPLLCAGDRSESSPLLHEWNGTSLGSPSRLLLYHHDRATAARGAAECAAEIERLERIFALYRTDSEIARLNRDGRIEFPSLDLLTVLSRCQALSALTLGAFDVSVQPLWTLYATHFFGNIAPPAKGPTPQAIERVRKLVDWRAIDVGPRRIVLGRPGMGLTLNGIAQGYVTDRVTEILREHGCDRTFANMGCSEIRTLGRHADGRPWRVGLADPRQPDTIAVSLDLCDRSLCTSGGYGTKFEATGRFHHLFDPASGASAHHYIAVSVFATSAMVADALSTALYVTPPERGATLLASFPGVSALATQSDGTVQRLPA
jgi:thiamine biosynthesis lipoprotein